MHPYDTLSYQNRRHLNDTDNAVALHHIAAHRRAEGSGRIGVLRLALDVAAVIVGIRPRLSRRLIVLADYSLTFKSSRFVGLDSF